QRSSTSRARSRFSATQVCPPTSENRHRNSRCASVSRPPSDFNSNAKPSSRAQPQCGQAPGRKSNRSDAPANAPMRFKLAASRISREPPLGTCSHSTPSRPRKRRCSTSAVCRTRSGCRRRWLAPLSGVSEARAVMATPPTFAAARGRLKSEAHSSYSQASTGGRISRRRERQQGRKCACSTAFLPFAVHWICCLFLGGSSDAQRCGLKNLRERLFRRSEPFGDSVSSRTVAAARGARLGDHMGKVLAHHVEKYAEWASYCARVCNYVCLSWSR